MDENLKLVIVGHVDHGKSTLIGRLFYDTDSLPDGKIEEIKQICESLGKDMEFGYVMDHLREERDQGITIDTAQIFFNTKKRKYTIIDVPGHVEFIKNMITGASQAEAAILIVDAEEGVKEQTRRHAYILSILGLRQVIVVINKMDILDYKKERFDKVREDILDFLKGIDIKPSYVIPISSKEGDNIANKKESMKWYEGITVLEALDTFKTRSDQDSKPLRFPVQDVYKWDKRIIVGKIETGTIKEGERIKILPSEEVTTVRSVEMFNKDISEATSGMSIGITTEDKVFADRGDIIVREDDKPHISDEIEANIFWLDRKPMEKGERLTFKCATQEVMCEVKEIKKKIDSSSLMKIEDDTGIIKNREVANVIIRVERPVVTENFNDIEELGRFVLERKDTCAGGIITEV